mgnify:CR=1 FL=1
MARPGDLEFPMSKSSLSDKPHRPHASVPQPAWGRMSGPPFLSFTSIRTPLFDQLVSADAPEAKLIAIAAPTGYGKTVLMTGLYEHYQRRGATCHWLALDDRDVTIERLLTHLEALLTRLDTKVDVNQALHQGDLAQAQRASAVEPDGQARVLERRCSHGDDMRAQGRGRKRFLPQTRGFQRRHGA